MRVLVVLRHLLPLVLSFVRDRRRWLLRGAPVARTREFHERRADRLVATLARLGPTFVKLAQVFAGRADLIPEPYVSRLSSLTDRVPPVPLEAIEREMLSAYGKTPYDLFERFDAEPIAAASLGQVHRARWRGREVAVKVLRPGVERLVVEDIAASSRILGWIERRWSNPHVKAARGVVDEFGVRIHEEMDFVREAANAREIRGNFAGNPRVRVPEVVDELVRPRVLVLEFMEGRKVDHLGEWLTEGRVSHRKVVEEVIELYLQMMLVDGLFHADPHPGNLLVAGDGSLVLLDFGMVVRVPRETRWNLIQTVFASIRKDVDGILAGFQSLGLIAPGTDPAALRALALELMDIAYSGKETHERMELVAEQVMAELYDWPIVLPRDMVYFARTAALIEGLGVRYDRRFNAVDFATPVAIRMRSRILASLGEPGGQAVPVDWFDALFGIAGQVASIVQRAGKEIFGAIAAGFGEVMARAAAAVPAIEPAERPRLLPGPALTGPVSGPANGANGSGAEEGRRILPTGTEGNR